MELWPAIDLFRGKAVRLHQGDYDKVTVYHDDPVALAASWRGVARHLHVVDLEGARSGRRIEADLVRRIIEAFGPGVEVGGGVRDREAIESYLALGAERVVLGTAAIRDPDLVREAATDHPRRMVRRSVQATARLAEKGGLPVLASGGIATLDDLRRLTKHAGISGAIVGKALYEKAFTLEEAVKVAEGAASPTKEAP